MATPKRKPPKDIVIPLSIPEPRGQAGTQHLIDAYKPLPGATLPRQKLVGSDKKATTKEKDSPAQLPALAKKRYYSYVDALIATRGDRRAALSIVYDYVVQPNEVDGLLDEVMDGKPKERSLDAVLDKHDLGRTSRLALLRQHAYSDNPAASLKAIDMVNDMDGASNMNQGSSYETYVMALMGGRVKK